jgi:hypothetical protein
MTTENGFLFHSLLSFALNAKMLHPMEVIQAAFARFQSTSGASGGRSRSWKGFVRQILGWREYMRGIYWAHMPAYAIDEPFRPQRPPAGLLLDGRHPHELPAQQSYANPLRTCLCPPHSAADDHGQFRPLGGHPPRRSRPAGTWASTSMPSNGWKLSIRGE